MFRTVFGRRGVGAPSAARSIVTEALARVAGVQSPAPPHPALEAVLAQGRALDAEYRGEPAQIARILAPLDGLDARDLVRLGHDALVRLPQSGLYEPNRRPPVEGRTLLTIIGRLVDAVAPASGAPTVVHGFTADQMVAVSRAMADLLGREWGNGTSWPIDAGLLFLVMLRPERLSRSPDVERALADLLVRVGYGGGIADYRLRLATSLVATLRLPAEASPTLVARDDDFAHRMAARERAFEHAGPALAVFMKAVLDGSGPVHSWSPKEFAAAPEVKAFLAQDAAALGAALSTMLRLTREFPGQPYGIDWTPLSLRDGEFPIGWSRPVQMLQALDRLAGLALRKRIDISDADMAALVRSSLDYNHGAQRPSFQSRVFLNQALKVAARPDGTETRAALAWLLDHRPEPHHHGSGVYASAIEMPAEWKHPIEDALGGSASGALPKPLEPPQLDWSRGDNADRLPKHFDALFDPRLHDERHDLYLLDAQAGAIEALARLDREEAAPQLARWRDDRLSLDERVGAFDRRTLADLHGRHASLDRLVGNRDAIRRQLDAVRPLVRAHAVAADRLTGLCYQIAGKGVPSNKWFSAAEEALADVPPFMRIATLRDLMTAFEATPFGCFAPEHNLRALIYLSPTLPPAEVGPLLTEFARRYCFVTEAGHGIRHERLGNGCLWALIRLPKGAGVPYLARLLARIKYPKVRAKIDAALNEAATAAGVSRGELDELTVPTHDLTRAGHVEFAVGGGRAVLRVQGAKVAIEWSSPDGKLLKQPGATMKADKPALAAVKAAKKEIEADLGVQVVRLQRLYLEDRRWSADDWRRRYLEHPLMRGLATRLLWSVQRDGASVTVLPDGDDLVDVEGGTVPVPPDAAVRLWHPIDADPAEVLAWRDRIERIGLVQPFAQAWREIYRLTDAERATGVYSNRWAGHILKQHQVMTLARLNGWTVTHRMWVDAPNDEPWHLMVPAHGLVADYWVEGAGGDSPEVLESCAYVYVNSDRLAFSRIASTDRDSARGPERSGAVPIEEVPAIILSEVMRHCDLFTAVGSIASDPAWRDRGGDAAHPNQWRRDADAYWERQSFGELTEAARTRRALLARIVPKLAIADKLTLDDDALTVRGTRHTYRIHLGSAAVQIVEQSRHLCIVPGASSATQPAYYVPFEGDRTLSLILSKAVLLVADGKITDPVILRQL